MSKQVPIEVFLIGHTKVDKEAVKRWLEFVGVKSDVLAEAGDDAITNPALLIALAAKRCYKSFEVNKALNPNITQIRKDWAEYLDNVMKSGHGSVLEHSVFTFAIENVSRVFTGEMNRHRAGWAISEGSMRFIRFSEAVPYWEPDSIKGPPVVGDDHLETYFEEVDRESTLVPGYTPNIPDLLAEWKAGDKGKPDTALTDDEMIAFKKEITRFIFRRAFEDQRRYYSWLEQVWADELAPESKFKQKKELTSLFRRIVGMGCATGGVWSGNVRALRHVITMRCEPAAEEEILHVFSRVAVLMKEKEPMLFGDFTETNGFWAPKYRKV